MIEFIDTNAPNNADNETDTARAAEGRRQPGTSYFISGGDDTDNENKGDKLCYITWAQRVGFPCLETHMQFRCSEVSCCQRNAWKRI